MKRISTGLPGMDEKIGGGFPENTCSLVSGSPGTGKTLFGLNFLVSGAKAKERCVYVSLNENREDLLRACDSIESLSDARQLLGKYLAVEEVDLSKVASLYNFTTVFERYPQVDRLVIDNVNKLLLFAENDKDYRRNLASLIKELRKKARASLLLCETRDDKLDTERGESYECDGVVFLDFLEVEEKPRRMLSVYKMRYTAFDERVHHELSITNKGLKVTKVKLV